MSYSTVPNFTRWPSTSRSRMSHAPTSSTTTSGLNSCSSPGHSSRQLHDAVDRCELATLVDRPVVEHAAPEATAVPHRQPRRTHRGSGSRARASRPRNRPRPSASGGTTGVVGARSRRCRRRERRREWSSAARHRAPVAFARSARSVLAAPSRPAGGGGEHARRRARWRRRPPRSAASGAGTCRRGSAARPRRTTARRSRHSPRAAPARSAEPVESGAGLGEGEVHRPVPQVEAVRDASRSSAAVRPTGTRPSSPRSGCTTDDDHDDTASAASRKPPW